MNQMGVAVVQDMVDIRLDAGQLAGISDEPAIVEIEDFPYFTPASRLTPPLETFDIKIPVLPQFRLQCIGVDVHALKVLSWRVADQQHPWLSAFSHAHLLLYYSWRL